MIKDECGDFIKKNLLPADTCSVFANGLITEGLSLVLSR